MSNKNRNQQTTASYNDFNDLKSSAANMANEVKSQASNAISNVNIDALKEQAGELKGKIVTLARNSYDFAKDEVVELKDKTAERIKDEPLRAGLIAFGAGAILGALLLRRR